MIDIKDYMKILDRFEGTRVLVLGDVVLDRFVYGAVDRISPEAPVPVLRIIRETEMLGGAGNVFSNIDSLGGRPSFTTVVGADEPGKRVQELVEAIAADEVIVIDADRPTTIKTRFVSGMQQLLRADHEVLSSLKGEAETNLIEHAVAAIRDVKAVVISDYAKGIVTERVARAVIAAANKAAIPVFVDCKPGAFGFFRGAAMLKPNRRELNGATGMPVGTDDEVVRACRELIRISGVKCIVATRTEQGMSIVTDDGTVTHMRTEAQEVYDVSGAGDTVLATIAMAVACGATMVEAAQLANHAAGIVVAKIGTAAIRLNELRAAIDKDRETALQKFMPLENAVDQVERWRARGVRIGFTNGVFDILHPGHISLIAQARKACDRLIVGLNSDESVRRLKGENRPVNDEASRAAVLSALEDVDAIVVFGEDTPANIIERLRPDLLVKGADYTLQTIVGADFVTSYGGMILIVDIAPGYSTTGTIERISTRILD